MPNVNPHNTRRARHIVKRIAAIGDGITMASTQSVVTTCAVAIEMNLATAHVT